MIRAGLSLRHVATVSVGGQHIAVLVGGELPGTLGASPIASITSRSCLYWGSSFSIDDLLDPELAQVPVTL